MGIHTGFVRCHASVCIPTRERGNEENLTRESRIQSDRRTNLLLIAALIIFALWLVGLSLKGSVTERQIRVNSGSKRSPYSVIFLGKIACHYAVFDLPGDYLALAQALLVGYFEKLEKG